MAIYGSQMDIKPILKYLMAASRQAGGSGPVSAWSWAVSIAALLAIVVGVHAYPLNSLLLGGGLGVYAAILWFRPYAWLLLLPALLPVLDLGPWSGWIFFNEFDFVVLTTIAVCYIRIGAASRFFSASKTTIVLVLMLALSYLASLVIGLFPLQPLDGNAFSNYLSHYNSLRVAKGFVWALLLFPLLLRSVSNPLIDLRRLFLRGMILGLAALVFVILWERFLFPGLFNFSNQYRVTALFSGMQTGGPQVETYISMVISFVAVWFLLRPGMRRLPVALALYVGATYAMLVTFSRAGYLALAIVTVVIVAGAFFDMRRSARWRWVFLAASAVALTAVVTPIVKGSFSESRLAHAGRDLDIRLAHWRSAMYMRDSDMVTRLLGMGLGSFPATYYLENEKGVYPGNFRFERQGGNGYLRLGGGDSLYMGQRVTIKPHTPYRLSMEVRNTSSKDSRLIVFICEKQLIYSFRCVRVTLGVSGNTHQWQHRVMSLNTGTVGIGHWYTRRPVEFSLSVPYAGALLDVDNVRLLGPSGKNLLVNGDFSAGSQRWFFTTDNGWPWRIENVWLQILFEQGWYGVVVFSALVLFQGYRLVRRCVSGDLYAAGLLAALIGPLTVGLFSSSFVSARLMMLFYLVLFISEIHLRLGNRVIDVPANGISEK